MCIRDRCTTEPSDVSEPSVGSKNQNLLVPTSGSDQSRFRRIVLEPFLVTFWAFLKGSDKGSNGDGSEKGSEEGFEEGRRF